MTDGADVGDVAIEIPAKPEYVALVRHVIGATARMAGLSPDAVENTKLAVSEACTNAVVVTGRGSDEGQVQVVADVEGDRVRVVVSDRGVYPEGDVPGEQAEASSLDFTFERGLSLPLIEGLADELDITAREGGGRTVTMTLVDAEASGAP